MPARVHRRSCLRLVLAWARTAVVVGLGGAGAGAALAGPDASGREDLYAAAAPQPTPAAVPAHAAPAAVPAHAAPAAFPAHAATHRPPAKVKTSAATAAPTKTLRHASRHRRHQRLRQLQTQIDPRIHPRQGLMGLLGLVLTGLAFSHLRQRRKLNDQLVGPGPAGYHPRPVRLDAPGPDPLTYGEPTGIHQLGVPGTAPLGQDGFRDVSGTGGHPADADAQTVVLAPNSGVLGEPGPVSLPASEFNLDLTVRGEAERAYAAAEIDRLTGSRAVATDPAPPPAGPLPLIRLASAGVFAQRPAPAAPRGASTPFPPALAAHYAVLANETLHWTATFHVPLSCSGIVALTSVRLLAVYERHRPTLLPPGMRTEVRLHHSPLGAVTGCAPAATKRPVFLGLGLLLFLLYPFGTLLACLSLGLYFGMPRAEVAVTSGGTRRLYPLTLGDQAELAKYLEQLRTRRGAPEAGQGPAHQQAG